MFRWFLWLAAAVLILAGMAGRQAPITQLDKSGSFTAWIIACAIITVLLATHHRLKGAAIAAGVGFVLFVISGGHLTVPSGLVIVAVALLGLAAPVFAYWYWFRASKKLASGS